MLPPRRWDVMPANCRQSLAIPQSLVEMIALPDLWLEQRILTVLSNRDDANGLLPLACDPGMRSEKKRFAVVRLIMCLIERCPKVGQIFLPLQHRLQVHILDQGQRPMCGHGAALRLGYRSSHNADSCVFLNSNFFFGCKFSCIPWLPPPPPLPRRFPVCDGHSWAWQAFARVEKKGEWRSIQEWLVRWGNQNVGPGHHRDYARVCTVLNDALAATAAHPSQVCLLGHCYVTRLEEAF
jgi:hypothetical protein